MTERKKLYSLLSEIAKSHGVKPNDVVGSNRNDALLAARREFFVKATQGLEISGNRVAGYIGWTAPAIYYHVNQWKKSQKTAAKRKKAA